MIEIPTTHLLYLDNAYLKEIDTQVVSVRNNLSGIEIKESIIYPGGGGQPLDVSSVNNVPIMSVTWDNSQLFYQIPPEKIKSYVKNQNVKIKLDWLFRYTVMRLHSAQHLLAAVILEKFGFKIAGNSIHPQRSHLDIETVKKFSLEEVEEIEDSVNLLIKKNLEIKHRNYSLSEIRKRTTKNRVRVEFLPNLPTYRIIEIESIDMVPCGGTHVRSTGEIGLFTINKYKSRGKSRKRFYYSVR